MVLGGRRRLPESGAAAVEFALVAPLLLLLVFGVISYGYMLNFRQGVSQAAAEGARAAAIAPATADRTAIAFASIEAVMGVACNTGNLHCTSGTAPSCVTCIAVTVSYDYTADPSKPVFPGMGFALPDTLTYTAVAGGSS